MRIHARPDPTVAARVLARAPLRYVEGPDPALDRPAHVRAGSALVWVGTTDGPRLAVVQDDASFLALVDPTTARATSIALPAGPSGARQFDAGRGNKADKLDLECAVAWEGSVWAFGSGSTPARERIAVVDLAARAARIVDAAPLYAALRSALPGVQLNVEGAALRDADAPELVLAHRGNGAGVDNTDALVVVPWPALVRFLAGAGPCPPVGGRQDVVLGEVLGVRLTWTDLAARGRALCFLAAAEDTVDAYDDGAVVACAIGVLDDQGARVGPIWDEDGAPLVAKPEGLCLDPTDPRRGWLVVDPDDPAQPTTLMTLALAGDLRGDARPA